MPFTRRAMLALFIVAQASRCPSSHRMPPIVAVWHLLARDFIYTSSGRGETCSIQGAGSTGTPL